MKHTVLKEDGFTLTEILTALVIIGVLSVLAFANYDKLINNTKALEAQQQLKYLHELQKMYHLTHDKFSNDFQILGFEQSKLTNNGGEARYKIEIIKADQNSYEAIATSIVDFDGDGQFNQWKVSEDGKLTQTVAD
jgi:type IV pilus assembly protein PilE